MGGEPHGSSLVSGTVGRVKAYGSEAGAGSRVEESSSHGPKHWWQLRADHTGLGEPRGYSSVSREGFAAQREQESREAGAKQGKANVNVVVPTAPPADVRGSRCWGMQIDGVTRVVICSP